MLGNIFPVIFAAGILAGCGSSAPPPTRSPSEIVTQRASERWDAMVAGDYGTVYDYMSPGYRETVTRDSFRLKYLGGALKYLGATVKDVSCPEENVCIARVDVQYEAATQWGKMTPTTVIEEKWLASEGRWWYINKN